MTATSKNTSFLSAVVGDDIIFETAVDPTPLISPPWRTPQRVPAGFQAYGPSRAPGSKKPSNTSFKQQTTPAYRPAFSSNAIALFFFIVGIPFTVLGGFLWNKSLKLQTHRIQYDGKETPQSQAECMISSFNEGRGCNVTFHIAKEMVGPIYVYYELSNFYQNMNSYVLSYDRDQLMGDYTRTRSQMKGCGALRDNGFGRRLNPCGLIANSLFNDQITGLDHNLSTKGIAWRRDKDKYRQPGQGGLCSNCDKFASVKASGDGPFSVRDCSNTSKCSDIVCDHWLGSSRRGCRGYFCSQPEVFNCEVGAFFAFYYPDQENQQYLYETIPEVVSPLQGVFNEHFIVWMRTAAFSKFPKLYGIVDETLAGDSTITFGIKNNFAVSINEGTKKLVISNTDWFGGWWAKTPPFLGISFVSLGSISILFGVGFFVKGQLPGCQRISGDLKRLLD